ncbi:MAG: DUF5698 domain-containing protein [Prevotellaceae bacterium]|jgi:uncharacterized protein YebE (UPF0316 family)|nr:DUF5698 domain-containing protein [Prevotellaceae bacterium]
MFEILFEYPYLPFLIFTARIVDVTIGTLRIVFVSKGMKVVAPILGFFEVLIWIVVISQILSKANDWLCYVTYAGGYATGNYIGLRIEERLAMGIYLVRIFTLNDGNELVRILNNNNFGATCLKGRGIEKEVDIVETVVGRKNMKLVESYIRKFDESAFFVIEDVRHTQRGIFPAKNTSLLRRWRIGK